MVSCFQSELIPSSLLPELRASTDEIKDPSIIRTANGDYHLYASVGSSVTQQWQVGHFVSPTPYGPWKELPTVTFDGIWGRELCAPAVTYCQNRKDPWVMYIQTSCFSENGIIVKATSSDGQHFKGTMEAIADSQAIQEKKLPVVGVYDAGVSDIVVNQETYECLLFSGYRRIGCGDLYISVRKAQNHEGQWPHAQLLMSQEELPFHNNPIYDHYEWGLEGAKIINLAPSLFLLVGVCFKPLPPEHQGTRQRVFFALSRSLSGPYHPWCLPLEGRPEVMNGEHGHPDIFVEDNTVWLYYQHRLGEGKPWYVRAVPLDLATLCQEAEHILKNYAPNNPLAEFPAISVPA